MLLNEHVKFTKTLGLSDLALIVDEIINISKNDNNIFILSANLGVGKSTLVKEIVKKLRLKDEAKSPTFSKLNIYDGKVFHYDLYNIELADFFALGLYEELEKNGLHFIEWGEPLIQKLFEFGFKPYKINIYEEDNIRRYELVTFTESTGSI